MSKNDVVMRVAVPVPIYRLFDYKCDQSIDIGARVLVPFGRRQLVGIVVDHVAQEDSVFQVDQLKPIAQVLDVPFLSKTLVSLAHWMAGYYLVPIGMVFELILPVQLRKGEPSEPSGELSWQIVPDKVDVCQDTIADVFGRAFAQRALFEYIQSKSSVNRMQLLHRISSTTH